MICGRERNDVEDVIQVVYTIAFPRFIRVLMHLSDARWERRAVDSYKWGVLFW